jgi:hypothetical protein
MKNDFNWLRKIISNKENKPQHYDAIIKLISLFKLKWGHNANNPKYQYAYTLYIAYLKMSVKRMCN